MKQISSNFIVKGFKHDNTYYIVKNTNENFNIYQAFCELNKDMEDKPLKDIKEALGLKEIDDEEILVSIPNEENTCFLFSFDIDIFEMNKFRIMLNSEETL